VVGVTAPPAQRAPNAGTGGTLAGMPAAVQPKNQECCQQVCKFTFFTFDALTVDSPHSQIQHNKKLNQDNLGFLF
jgi:hypothetical protein